MISPFFMNTQIKELIEFGYIEFSNDDLLPEYETELQRRKVDYRIVEGLGEYAVTIAICTPRRYRQFVNQLNREIVEARAVLAAKERAQRKLQQ